MGLSPQTNQSQVIVLDLSIENQTSFLVWIAIRIRFNGMVGLFEAERGEPPMDQSS
jgi:hypothetical protein